MRGWLPLLGRALQSTRANPKSAALSTLPVVNNEARWFERMAGRAGLESMFGFYSSVAGAITTRPELMCMPIDDHAIVRGHACFDTCTLKSGRLYRMRVHLERFVDSANQARIPLPFGPERETNISRMAALITETCVAAGRPTASVRFWLSAGHGNLGVTPDGCTPGFYILVSAGLPSVGGAGGLSEITIRDEQVPMKGEFFAGIKSNNYLQNALTAMASRDKGGVYGIGVDAQENIREASIMNVCIVTRQNELKTPPFVRVLKGTTVRKVMELATTHLVPSALVGVKQCEIPLKEVLDAKEMFLVGGDVHSYPVVRLDGSVIGNGKPGPVYQELVRLLERDSEDPAICDAVIPGLCSSDL